MDCSVRKTKAPQNNGVVSEYAEDEKLSNAVGKKDVNGTHFFC